MARTVRFGDEFEWDESKAAQNPRKHAGVTFEEASTVFEDGDALFDYDQENSKTEDRFVVIGYSDADRLIVANYTIRKDRVRIISARKPRPSERRQYANET